MPVMHSVTGEPMDQLSSFYLFPMPHCRYGGWSYEEALLNPVADAVGAAAKPWTKVHFALQAGQTSRQNNKRQLARVPAAGKEARAAACMPVSRM
jgi:hypothetical protein